MYSSYLALCNGNPATVLSWASTAANVPAPLLSPQIAELTARTSFDFQQPRQWPTVLYIKVNQRDIAFYSFILDLLPGGPNWQPHHRFVRARCFGGVDKTALGNRV